MDPKILQILRALFGVDNKSLPDSMTPDEFGKFIDENKGKLFGNPDDYKKLQRIISQKDVDIKKLTSAVEDLKRGGKKSKKKSKLEKIIAKQADQLTKITDELNALRTGREREALQKKYPDISPDLLIGKSPEEIEGVVASQRALNKKIYGDAKHFRTPTYDDAKQINEEIEKVKDDKSISGEKSAVKVLKLNREKDNLEVDSSSE